MNALDIRNLSKVYKNGFTALKSVSLQVQSGDFFALLGPNGAGKTTLIGIITSLINSTSGDISVFGYDAQRERDAVKSCIGLVPQEFNFNIFKKVIHVVADQAGYYGVPYKLACVRAEKYLRQLDLWDKRHDTVMMLSGGMKRRLMIARALVHEPRLLLLDEPTAGVDIEIRRSMWKFFQTLNQQGVTIILTTHNLEEAESLCRNIAIIDHGEIIEDTSMADLLQKLHIESFILDLKEPLTEAPHFLDFPYTVLTDRCLEVTVAGNQTLNVLFDQLDAENLEVVSMRNKANRLEELFMRLVSKGLSQ